MTPLLPLLVAGGAAALLTPVTQMLARRFGVVNAPEGERWSTAATPLLGGAAILGGFLVGAAFFLPWADPRLRAVVAGALVLFVVGLLDDTRGVRPSAKLAAQLIAGAILIIGGVEVEIAGRRIIGIPLTIFWVVGISNALNLLDNMDGLAAGVAAIAALVLAAFAASSGLAWLCPLALCVAGGALGFLPWNVNPAKQFMGDAGALPLGFLLAATGILGTYREAGNVLLVLVAPVFVLGVPILDTTLVTLVRKFHGRKVSQGGRDHLSHRLVALGMSERKAVAVLWTVTAGFGALALVTSPDPKAGLSAGTVLLFLLAAAGAAIFGVVLGEVKVYRHVAEEAGTATPREVELRRTFLRYVRALAVVVLDLGFIAGAYVAAHVLRFDGRGAPFDQQRFFDALPVIVVAKLVALQVFGLQRGLWRHFGLRDLAAVGKAVVTGSLLAAAGLHLAHGSLQPFSKYVLVLDGILLFLMIVGSRAIFRLMVEQLAGFPPDGTRVLLVGAGEEGDLALRSLRLRGGVRPVGVLDDDSALRGRQFHGIPILGAVEDLGAVLEGQDDVEEVVLSRSLDPEIVTRLKAVAGPCGVRILLAPSAHRFTEL